jgi:hypothetical protein
VPYDNGTANYSDPRALPAMNFISDSDVDVGVDMGEARLILYGCDAFVSIRRLRFYTFMYTSVLDGGNQPNTLKTLLLKTQLERNPAAAPILFYPRTLCHG